ncbi:helix-turn-helix domain-containing protein [Paenibacillus sp. FSL L8-0470]|uniref:helix-turn-helix domain-containing protein n=1 Tax=Paenibacillus sp. FSL L8-0470 TaxID=2954688 RepID=UPI0030F9EBD5
MLIITRQKISDIAGQCGFNSFSQFNRVFNKLSGMSPSAFRKHQASSSPSSTLLSY